MSASIVELNIVKGKTLELALFVGEEERVMKPITAVVATAPMTLTVPGHGLVDDWEIEISGVRAPSQLNTGKKCADRTRVSYDPPHETFRVRVVDDDTIILFNVNGSAWPAYSSGGIVEFNKPSDLTGCEARAQMRRRIGSDEVVLEFYSSGLPEYDPQAGVIEVDIARSRYVLRLPAGISEELEVSSGVWDAEYIAIGGEVYPLVAVSPYNILGEVTR